MKIRLFMVLLVVITGCTFLNRFRDTLTETRVREHLNFLVGELQQQGFTLVRGKPENDKIFFDCRINDKPTLFLFDSGATFSIISNDHAIACGLIRENYPNNIRPGIVTFFGTISEYDHAIAGRFEIAGQRFDNWPLIVYDANKEYGVLGTDFMHFTNCIFVPRSGIILFNNGRKPAENISERLVEWGYLEIPLSVSGDERIDPFNNDRLERMSELNSGALFLDLVFDNVEGKALLDTGTPYSFFDKGLTGITARKRKALIKMSFKDAAGNMVQTEAIHADSLITGDYLLGTNQWFPVFEDLNRNTDRYSSPHIGVIGMDCLSQNNAIMDFGNKKIYLQK